MAASLGALLCCGAWFATRPSGASASEAELVRVVFEDPPPKHPDKPGGAQAEACATSCSLAKHKIAPFHANHYEEALRSYALADPEEASEALETLLFYGVETREYLELYGAEGLPEQHLEVLRRELARDHALVALRLVDESGEVRVNYGPQRVPLGQKQHLMPLGDDLQAMEFNGTVMRTGVNYLWSRY